jgi:putative ABC transport system permease protein
MVRIGLSALRARWRRSLATCVAVVIGVAFLTGTLVLGSTLSANFDRLFRDVSAGTSVVVRNAAAVDADGPDANRGLVDGRLIDTVRGVDGVAAAQGQVVGYGSLLGKDGDAIGGNGPPRQAGSWITDPGLNPYRLVEGRAPRADDEVVVNRGAADSGKLAIGDTTTLRTPAPVAVKIVGIADFGTSAGLGQTTFTAFTLRAAQEQVTRQPGRVSAVVVRAERGVDDTVLRDRIREVLPRGVEAITGDQLADERVDNIASTFLDGLRTGLVAFAAIALVVATLSINNTFSISVAQRTRELALLRAVGASRRQVRLSVIVEALVVGAISAGVGLAVGIGFAGLLKGLFDAFGFALPAGGLTVTTTPLVVSFLVGVGATVVAAQTAARRASSVAPIAALQAAASEPRGLGRVRLLVGGVLVLAGAVAAGAAIVDAGMLLAITAALALVVGCLLVAPALLPPVARAVGAVLRRLRGSAGRFAEQNVRRNPRRSATTATALVVGVMVVSMFTVFVASMRATLDEQVSTGLSAELVVSTPVFGGGGLSPDLARAAATRPEFDAAVGIGGGPVRIDGRATTVTATDVERLPRVMTIDTVAGALDRVGDRGIAVDVDKARDEGWRVGTVVALTFPGGETERATVRALYDDADLVGSVLVPTATWDRHSLQPIDTAVFLSTAPGTDVTTARAALRPLVQQFGGDVQVPAEFASSTTSGLDLLLGIVYVMLALAVLIALLGIANTLSLAVYERQREFGLLRAVGQTRRQLRAALRMESVIVATFGTLLGLALGGVLGTVLFATAFGDGTVALPGVQLAVIAGLGAAAGFLAGLRPAGRAARVPILDAIAAT